MKLTYRTRRRLQLTGWILLVLALVGAVFSFCWVIWAERYILYTKDGAVLDFSLAEPEGEGQLAVPPSANETVNLLINEGADAVDPNADLAQIRGYYIDEEMLTTDLAGVQKTVATLESGTAVMIDLKSIRGEFFYTSGLPDAAASSKIDRASVDTLIQNMNKRNLYTIARIPAFRDRQFGLNHVNSGVLMSSKKGLWMDDKGCYWLRPSDSTAMNWVSQIIGELKELGFDEVVLTDFRVPANDKIFYEGDRNTDLQATAKTLASTWATGNFAVSFVADSPSFQLPEGRTRMYLENVGAKDIGSTAAQVTVPDNKINLVFLATTNDTRYNEYSVLRPIGAASIIEEQGQAETTPESQTEPGATAKPQEPTQPPAPQAETKPK